ncbi:MAG: oligosaccharide flippase family protein [Acidobacteriota bacterium]|nr:oligosaccharide flippase family protein [Acidobacteriota bacterium]
MSRVQKYISNVLWSWAGVVLTILIGFFFSPYIIRRVGDTNFAIWALALSLVDYYWLIDFGFRSATLKFSAEFQALEDFDSMSVLLSTGLLYTTLAGSLVLTGSFLLAPWLATFFHIQQPDFILLIRIVGLSWALGMVSNVFSACLEGHQRFDLTNRVWIISMTIRTAGILILLVRGGGVAQMGYMLLSAQVIGYLCTYKFFRTAVPRVRVSYALSSFQMMKKMMSYGIHTFTTIASNLLLTRSIPILIARFLPIRFLAYWQVPTRILEYTTDGFGRIGMVTAPNASELMARGKSDELVNLAVYSNRYCFTLFTPLAVFLLTYGFQLYSLWIRPEFARNCAYLLPVLLIGETVFSGQTNSVSILFGMGRHKVYSRLLLLEAGLTVGGLAIVLRPYGLYGAAWVIATLMTLNRGIGLCCLVSRVLGINPLRYATRIYAVPALMGGLAWVFMTVLRTRFLPGRTVPELLLAGTLMMLLYAPLAFRFCVAPHHREKAFRAARTGASTVLAFVH